VLNSIVSYENNEQVQQANLFKRQTLMSHFSTYRRNSFEHLSHLSTSFWMPDAKKRCWLLSKPLMNSWLHFSIRCKFLLTYHFLHWPQKMIVTGAKSRLYGGCGNISSTSWSTVPKFRALFITECF